ncbi:MAG TPA: hypothetical protein PLV43_11660 [Aequorivita sp.]|nr:hypothetical protein [Aequorivita sp.]
MLTLSIYVEFVLLFSSIPSIGLAIALLDSLIAIKPVLWFKKEKWKLI